MSKFRRLLIFAGIVLAVSLSVATVSFSGNDLTTIEKTLRKLAGHGATDCGLVRPQAGASASSECVLKSFADHQPFYVVYDTQEVQIDTHFLDALAGDRLGNLFDVEFSSRGWDPHGLPAGAHLLQSGRIFVESCPKPMTLQKFIYEGLTCIPRIEAPANH